MFITLRCQKCDNVDCPMARAYVPYESNEGCTRDVSEQEGQLFHHMIEEVLPFARTQTQFEAVESCLAKVYASPLGRKLDAFGKALPLPASNSAESYENDTEPSLEPSPARQEDTHTIDILSL